MGQRAGLRAGMGELGHEEQGQAALQWSAIMVRICALVHASIRSQSPPWQSLPWRFWESQSTVRSESRTIRSFSDPSLLYAALPFSSSHAVCCWLYHSYSSVPCFCLLSLGFEHLHLNTLHYEKEFFGFVCSFPSESPFLPLAVRSSTGVFPFLCHEVSFICVQKQAIFI